MRAELPPGYRLVRTGRALVAAHDDALAFVQRAVAEAGSLHAWSRERAERLIAGGRGAVALIDAPTGRWAVRHYHRGGALAPLLQDRYPAFGIARPFAELNVSETLRRRGIDTPRVHAAVVYRAGGWYRGDVATEYIDHAADLATLSLSPDAWPESERVEAWRAAGALLAAFFATGAVHADLNLRNVIVERAAKRAHLLDLDRCTLPPARDANPREKMLARFQRSRRKLEKRFRRTVSGAEQAAFQAALMR